MRASLTPLVAAALTAAVTGLYWVVLDHQAEPVGSRPLFVTVSLDLAVLALVAAPITSAAPLRTLLLAFAAGTLLLWTVLAALSIGLLLLLPTAFAARSAADAVVGLGHARATAALTAGLGVATAVVVLVLTCS